MKPDMNQTINDTPAIRLTHYSHGAGCGCKISPQILDTILHGSEAKAHSFQGLLVGNDHRDDAAVFELGNGLSLISTTDFFMPIVDDPFQFGRIAAANAISDVYAMGGRPLMAIAILGWPLDKLDPAVAAQVVDGGRSMCLEAGIPLAGGHSIDCPEPIFGLAVNGLVDTVHLKRNSEAQIGDLLFLSKPLGVGILTTAEKKSSLLEQHRGLAATSMMRLNRIGAELGPLPYVHALTDVTGFGLLGHLSEMTEGSGCSARIQFSQVPQLDPHLETYVRQGCVPGGTQRNWSSYGHKIHLHADLDVPLATAILADPQTSGGLLIAVDPKYREDFEKVCLASGWSANLEPIGVLEPYTSKRIVVEP